MGILKKDKMRKISQSRRDRVKKKLIGTLWLCLFIILFVQRAAASGKETSAQIILAPNNVSILQDEAVPKLSAKAECTQKQQEVVLNEETGYTVKDLVEKLNKGKGYTLSCEADGSKEGEFVITLKLDKTITKEIGSNWPDLVYLTTSDGVLKVKNKYGEWDEKNDKKFLLYDGKYAKERFVESKGKTYYFDTSEEKVTGWQTINGYLYEFSKTGVMQVEKFVKTKDGTFYAGKDGIMVRGWQYIDGALYYFDEDCRMVTGSQQISASKCEFDEDGKLISRETNIDPEKPMMALTFDDGPGERTNEILDVLEKNDAHATFFMLGQKVEGNEDLLKRMYSIGCELGNHSYDHPQLTELDDGGADQIYRTNEIIRDACGHYPSVMRPPYGAVDETVAASVGLPMIIWNVDTLDWSTLNADATIDNVLTNADDGDIILMHDIHSSSVDAAVYLIPELVSRGYQLVTVTEMAQARGIFMENGVSYTDFNREGEDDEDKEYQNYTDEAEPTGDADSN